MTRVPLLPISGRTPRVASSSFIADGAYVIGDVDLAPESSVWFQAVLRGDINSIQIGERSNVQDGSVFHVTDTYPVTVGAGVTIGHRAIIHGCTIGDSSLIGMGAIVLDNARIGEESLVGAGAVVLENSVIPPRSLAAGVPAKVLRSLTTWEIQRIKESADHYVEYARTFSAG